MIPIDVNSFSRAGKYTYLSIWSICENKIKEKDSHMLKNMYIKCEQLLPRSINIKY